MKKHAIEIVRGSGNVFRDLGHPDADILQAKAILAARIIGVLDDRRITVRRAHELTGFAAADFSRVRQAKLQRFTLERLISMLVRLSGDVEVNIEVKPRRHVQGRGGRIARKHASASSAPTIPVSSTARSEKRSKADATTNGANACTNSAGRAMRPMTRP